jgi:alcohol dehydrogenase
MVRAGGTVGYVGLPHGVSIDIAKLFFANVTICGGISPAHHYIADILPAVLNRTINPGRVYSKRYRLEDVAEAYDDMDNRRTVKPLITVR